MKTEYLPLKKIPADDLFDGHLEKFSIREDRIDKATLSCEVSRRYIRRRAAANWIAKEGIEDHALCRVGAFARAYGVPVAFD